MRGGGGRLCVRGEVVEVGGARQFKDSHSADESGESAFERGDMNQRGRVFEAQLFQTDGQERSMQLAVRRV